MVAATTRVNVVLKCFVPLRVRQKIEVSMPNECHFRELLRRIEQNQHHLRAKYHCIWMLSRCARRHGANKQFNFSGGTEGIVIACEFWWSFMLFSRCLPWKELRDDQQFFWYFSFWIGFGRPFKLGEPMLTNHVGRTISFRNCATTTTQKDTKSELAQLHAVGGACFVPVLCVLTLG